MAENKAPKILHRKLNRHQIAAEKEKVKPKKPTKEVPREQRIKELTLLVNKSPGDFYAYAKKLGFIDIQFKFKDPVAPSKSIPRSAKDQASLVYCKELQLGL